MIIVNTDFIEGKKLGMINNVRGTTASANRLNEESSIATKRMVDKAKAMGADAVINVRYASIISMNFDASIRLL